MSRPRIYLSGPISGMPDLNRPAFAAAQEALEAAGYVVVNPLDVTQATNWQQCMRDDIKALMDCEGVATLDGWEGSTGAVIEVELAMKLRMPVKPVKTWRVWGAEAQA